MLKYVLMLNDFLMLNDGLVLNGVLVLNDVLMLNDGLMLNDVLVLNDVLLYMQNAHKLSRVLHAHGTDCLSPELDLPIGSGVDRYLGTWGWGLDIFRGPCKFRTLIWGPPPL